MIRTSLFDSSGLSFFARSSAVVVLVKAIVFRPVSRVRAKLGAASQRGQEWLDRQDPGSRRGVAIGAWRRYRAVEGPLQTALLSIYILVAVLPAVLVMEEYLDRHPNSLANSLVHHYRLNASNSELIHNVLGSGRAHELGSGLFAIAG